MSRSYQLAQIGITRHRRRAVGTARKLVICLQIRMQQVPSLRKPIWASPKITRKALTCLLIRRVCLHQVFDEAGLANARESHDQLGFGTIKRFLPRGRNTADLVAIIFHNGSTASNFGVPAWCSLRVGPCLSLPSNMSSLRSQSLLAEQSDKDGFSLVDREGAAYPVEARRRTEVISTSPVSTLDRENSR